MGLLASLYAPYFRIGWLHNWNLWFVCLSKLSGNRSVHEIKPFQSLSRLAHTKLLPLIGLLLTSVSEHERSHMHVLYK